jgi:hypothetical protein
VSDVPATSAVIPRSTAQLASARPSARMLGHRSAGDLASPRRRICQSASSPAASSVVGTGSLLKIAAMTALRLSPLNGRRPVMSS